MSGADPSAALGLVVGSLPLTTYAVREILPVAASRGTPGQSYLIVAAALAVARTRPRRVGEFFRRDPRLHARTSLLDL
jgi:hypothetical protein